MSELTVQIAEFAAPFPAKIFENELLENGIRFKAMPKSNSEGGFSSNVYFINSDDYERAVIIREKIDQKNAKSEEKHLHPIRKKLAYLSLILIVIYLIFELYKLINQDY